MPSNRTEVGINVRGSSGSGGRRIGHAGIAEASAGAVDVERRTSRGGRRGTRRPCTPSRPRARPRRRAGEAVLEPRGIPRVLGRRGLEEQPLEPAHEPDRRAASSAGLSPSSMPAHAVVRRPAGRLAARYSAPPSISRPATAANACHTSGWAARSASCGSSPVGRRDRVRVAVLLLVVRDAGDQLQPLAAHHEPQVERRGRARRAAAAPAGAPRAPRAAASSSNGSGRVLARAVLGQVGVVSSWSLACSGEPGVVAAELADLPLARQHPQGVAHLGPQRAVERRASAAGPRAGSTR